ncbi:MAG TPA: alpha/beta fold hydrolase [Gemmatimonadaceae bacterium]|nr:alpha/beta fold hydrolase [Gemmatimonadaceae bacterium]
MKKAGGREVMRLRSILLCCCLIPSAAWSQRTSFAGTWTGYWTRSGDTLPVTMVVQRDTTRRHTATFDAERLRVSGIPFADVRIEGCCDVTLVLRGDVSTIEFTGHLHGDSLSGVFREGTRDGRFTFVRARPVSPAFDEREVTFQSGANTLAGTLLLPRGQRPVPAVVFLHGSGPEGRWASRFLASRMAERGIAALIFDKRGVGGSSGDWRAAGPDDLAADAVAAVARLLNEPRIDPKRIGIHGHSQGGTLAPLVAVRSPHVAFVIASAAAGLSTDSVEIFSILNSVLPRAATADDSASARQYTRELVSVAYHGQPRARLDSLVERFDTRPWFFAPPAPDNHYWTFSRVFATYDAIAWWSRVRVPVLLVYGAEDQRVPAAASASRIEGALRSGGNTQVTVQLHPGADHTFRLRPGPGGWPVTAPDYVSGLLSWLAQRSALPPHTPQ